MFSAGIHRPTGGLRWGKPPWRAIARLRVPTVSLSVSDEVSAEEASLSDDAGVVWV